MIIFEKIYSDNQEDIANIAEVLIKVALKIRDSNGHKKISTDINDQKSHLSDAAILKQH